MANTRLEINFDFGLSELNRYLEDLVFLRAGAAYADLGIGERRAAHRMKMIVPTEYDKNHQFAQYGFQLYDESNVSPGSIALLQLSGIMRTDGGASNPGISSVVERLRWAYANDNVDGIVIETKSGGGESLAGTMLKSAIAERNKPVVGLGHMAASAAYRALSGADEIIASGDSAEFGSIGTFITLDQKAIAKYRERYTDFYGANAPEKNAAFREVIQGGFGKIQAEVDRLTDAFHEEIKKDRPLQGNEKRIAETLSGKMFEARDAKSRGLIDGIGNLQYAVRRVQAMKPKYKRGK